MKVDKVGIHRAHCCVLHGCKYGHKNCPVVTQQIKQEYLCEDCESEGDKTVKDVELIKGGFIPICQWCGHVDP
jgi:hypothetical protein